MLSRDAAGSAEEVGKETKTQYTFLFDRSIIEPVVEAAEAVAEAAEAVVESVESAAASPVAEVFAASPEAAMEVEPVA